MTAPALRSCDGAVRRRSVRRRRSPADRLATNRLPVIAVRTVLCGLCLTALSACRGTPEGLCRVEGSVTVDGLPAEAELTFYPLEEDAGRPVIVVTDSNGRFRVDPRSPRQQLPPGNYRIDIRVRTVQPATSMADDSARAGSRRETSMPDYLLTVRLTRRLTAPRTWLRFALRS